MHSHTVYRDRDAMARNAAHERIPRVPKSEGKGKASTSADKDKDGKEKEKDEPTTIMTYCYGEQRVYVSHTHDYDTALSLAFQEFPEFDPTGPERMQFSIAVRVKTGDARVRVSRSAWPNVAAQMRQWEVVYVNQLPVGAPVPRSPYPPLKELELDHLEHDNEKEGEEDKEGELGLPKYEPPAEGSQFLTVEGDEKPRTTAHSPSHSHSRSPTHSRPASTHSRASSRERSPGLGDRVKNWFKNDSD